MGRPKKAPPVLPKASMTPVHDILAKARALVNQVGKRKVGDDGTTPQPCVSKAKVSAPAPVTSPQVVKACPPPPAKRIREKSCEPPTAAKSTGVVMKAVPMPSKAHGTPPAEAASAPKPPPPKAVSPSVVTESSESPTTTSSTPGSASARVQAHLAKAKEMRLVKEMGSGVVPPKPVVPDPSMSPVRMLGDFDGENGDDTPSGEHGLQRCKTDTDTTWIYDYIDEYGDDFACSQRQYYGLRGKSWWRDDGWGNQWGKNWFWDPYQYRYVWTWGSRSWSTDSWPEPTEASQTPSDSPNATDVHAKLAARLPTQPDLSTPARTEVSDHEASEAKPEQEQDAANHVESEDDEGAESWRRDKYGNILNPNALYMRFYRRLRSILICT